jgi:predicted transposase YdaD
VAILSNYPKEEAETILRQIVLKLKTLVKNRRIVKKYINQLMMLSRLRKIEALAIKITEEMPIHYDIETDALYQRGTEKGFGKGRVEGIERGREQEALKKNYLFVTDLLLDTDFDDERIARLVKVHLPFVQQVKEERNNFVSVSGLLLDSDFDDEKIANLLNLSLSFIQKVRLILA